MIKAINRTKTAWLILFDVIDTDLHRFLARDLLPEAAEHVVRAAEALGPDGRAARKLEQDKLDPDYVEGRGIVRTGHRSRCECGRPRRWYNTYCNQDEAILMDARMEEKKQAGADESLDADRPGSVMNGILKRRRRR